MVSAADAFVSSTSVLEAVRAVAREGRTVLDLSARAAQDKSNSEKTDEEEEEWGARSVL